MISLFLLSALNYSSSALHAKKNRACFNTCVTGGDSFVFLFSRQNKLSQAYVIKASQKFVVIATTSTSSATALIVICLN